MPRWRSVPWSTPSASGDTGRAACTNRLASGVSTPSRTKSTDTPRSSHASRRIRRQDHVGRPTGNRARRQQDRVANGFIASATPVEHAPEHRHVDVGVVVDAHFALAVMQTVKPTRVLSDRATPRDGQREKQRVQPRVVESFAHVLARRQNDPALSLESRPADRRAPVAASCPCPPAARPGARRRASSCSRTIEMVVALRQHQRRSAFLTASITSSAIRRLRVASSTSS